MQSPVALELSLRLLDEDMSSRRFSKESRAAAKTAVDYFKNWTRAQGHEDIRTLGRKDLVAYHTWLSQQKSKRTGESLKPGTVNDRFQVIRKLYSCMYRARLIPENPMHGLKVVMPDPGGWKRRPLSKAEITQFLESIDTSSAQGFKDRTLFELIYSSGLRVNEAASLKVADIDFERRFIVVRGKFDRDRKVPISEVASAFLKRYLDVRLADPEAWVFMGSCGPTKGGHLRSASVSERFRTLLRRYGMDKPEISTHSIRHSTATHLLENGASVRHVQELLGHACIESTVRYTHVMTDGLAKVYRRYHPREHELFEVVDEEYMRRLQAVVGQVPSRNEGDSQETS